MSGTQPAATAPRREIVGERRQLTVMFCDVVGSTPLAESLDPENLRELLLEYQSICDQVLTRHDGYVANILGDGVLVYFGFPHPREDAAYRGVIAGIEICEAVKEAAPQFRQRFGVDVDVRVGLHTGLVVISSMGGGDWTRENDIVGVVPNLASRLQSVAEPGAVAISGDTYQLVRGLVEVESLGPIDLRGLSAPVDVYRAVRSTGAETRFRATDGFRTPLVGRDEELSEIRRLWDQASPGGDRALLVVGEPGIGKSRLIEAAARVAADADVIRFDAYCTPRTSGQALYPIAGMIERAVEIAEWDEPSIRVQKLERALEEAGQDLPTAVPLFASVLNLPVGDRYRTTDLTPEESQRRTFDAIHAWLRGVSHDARLLMVFEDLHWADATTVEFLQRLLQDLPAGVALVITTRPESPVAWRVSIPTLHLTGLTDEESMVLVQGVVGDRALPEESVRAAAQKGDGVPLFVEEIARMLAESAATDGPEVANLHVDIPATVQALLLSRLDRLSTGKALAQVAATIGRESPVGLLEAVAGLSPDAFAEAVNALLDSELWEATGLGRFRTFRFRHALIQDTAYQSQLIARRREVHLAIANAMRERFPEIAEEQPQVLAYHLEEAEEIVPSIEQWRIAGIANASRGAHGEAVGHFRHALDLVRRRLPEGPERNQLELGFELFLGDSLAATQGYAGPEVEAAFSRANELCDVLGRPVEVVPALVGLWGYYYTKGQYAQAADIAAACLRHAEAQDLDDLRILAHSLNGAAYVTKTSGDEIRASLTHFDQAIELFERTPVVSPFVTTTHPIVQALSKGALQCWRLGMIAEARRRIAAAVAQAEFAEGSLGLSSRGYALAYRAFIHYHSESPERALESAEEAVEFNRETGLLLFLAASELSRGASQLALGRREEGLQTLASGIAQWRMLGAGMYVPWYLGLLAEKQLEAGALADAAATVNDAFSVLAEQRGNHFEEAELRRIHGEVLAATDVASVPRAIEEIEHALELARERDECSFELRAAMSLARVREPGPERAQALETVGELATQLAEGADSPDLIKARLLLEAEGSA